ncbi:MAG TPA: hypothetical protein VFU21_10660 [Kofleriaceae bacterium]|nr:hypothetical protein [Kofleriaceae bacterium]
MALLTATACGGGDEDDDLGEAQVTVEVPLEGIPPDGQCTHIIATRLSDFRVSSYQGALGGAVFQARQGEHRVTAVAYPPPCDPEPAEPPWIADEQVVTFVRGPNSLTLNFRTNVGVGVDPIFWDDVDPQLAIEPGSTLRTGRNFEDAAGGNFAVDGWDVLQIALPPAGGGGTPSATVLFSTQPSGALAYTPRGMARMPDGRFVFQLAESAADLQVFTAGGAFLESWPVVRDPGLIQFDSTDGLDRIDTTRLVRTAFLNTPLNCPEFSGPECIQAAIEVLELQSGPSGTSAVVIQQILLPFPHNVEYPLGVTASAGNFIVSTLPDADSRLLLLDAAGTLLAGPVTVAGGIEGLFLNGSGTRLGALTYVGFLSMHSPATLLPRAGETFNYPLGVGVSNPFGLAWRPATGQFLVLHIDNQVTLASDTFTATAPSGIDTSGYIFPSSIDVNGSDQLLVFDRIPPIDPATEQRVATLDTWDLATGVLVASVPLGGVPVNVRPRTLAYMPGTDQVISHYRRAGNVVDPIDSTIFVHQMDGTLAAVLNLAPWGVHRIVGLNVLPSTGEILLVGTDVEGTLRLMVTTPGGTPVRSYRTDSIFGLAELAPITTGAFAGQVGVVTGQPSSFLRIAAP